MRVRFAGERVIRSLATRIARLGGRTADESGVALVTVLVVVSAMTISTGMMVQMMTSNEKAFGRDRQVARATNIGQQGLNYGVAYMQSYLATYDSGNTLPIGSAVGTAASPKFSGSIDSGTMSWFATKTVSGAWTIYANAVSPSGDVSRRLSLTMGATASTTSTGGTASPVYAFGYVMADPNADCAGVTPPVNGGDSISNAAALTVPIFIASSLCVSAGAPVVGEPAIEPAGVTQSVTLYVGKTFRTASTGSPVGTAGRPIKDANIVAGCQAYFKNKWTNQICSTPGTPLSGAGSGIFASSYQALQQPLTKPPIDTGTYSSALPGPAHDCNGSSVKGLLRLDNDATRNTSLQIPAASGSIGLLHLKNTNQSDAGNNFDCRFYDGAGTLVGQMTWADGNPGTLTVKGVIFLDGNLSLTGNDKAVYQGIGVIYVNGAVTAANGARLCGGPMVAGSCPNTWDPATNNLELVAINQQNVANGVSFVGDAQVQGIVFMNGNFSSTNGANIYGSVIADSGQLSGNAQFASPPQPPPGAPGSAVVSLSTSYVWNVPKGGWAQY